MTPRSNSRSDQDTPSLDAMKLRQFPPKQRNTILQTLRYALNVKSEDDLPRVFRLPVAVALKPGSKEELAARFNVPGHKTDPRRMAFGSAMALYCRSSQYGHALITCEHLYSIDMEPDAPPSSEDRNHGRALTGQSVRKGAHLIPRKALKVGADGAQPAPKRTRADRSRSRDEITDHPTRQSADPSKPDGSPGRDQPPRSPQERRQFHPDQRRQLLELFRTALSVESVEDLPAFLKEEIAIPLRIGCHKDLILRYNLPKDDGKAPRAVAFQRAIFRYTRCRAYQHALLNCETRFTIDMEPAEPVTEEHRKIAIATLRAMNKRRQEYEERTRLEQERQDGTDTASGEAATRAAVPPTAGETKDPV